MTQLTEKQLLERIDEGKLIERVEQMSPVYLAGMKRILTVSADTELISAPAYYRAAQDAPSTNAYLSAMSIIQDEIAHAHIAYRLLEDMGVSKEQLVYERKPEEFKYPYAFDVPLETWTEFAVATAFYDRAGYTLLGDIFQHTSFGPWKRALVKVDKEESFHLRHGETWMRKLNKTAEGHAKLQRAVDWMFPLTMEWFGLPDHLKKHTEQIDYGFKGSTNDQLRQIWLGTGFPFIQSLGLDVPAHWDKKKQEYALDYPFPCRFIAAEKRWLFEEGQISWDDVMVRWKARGPMNKEYITQLQKGYHELNGNGSIPKRSWREVIG